MGSYMLNSAPRFWRITLALVALLLVLPLVTGINSGLSPDTLWRGQVGELPIWLQLWLMGVMTPMFFVSLFFLRRSVEARFLVGGVVLSHVPMAIHLFDVTVGVVGLVHIVCLSPALYLLVKKRPAVELRTAFGLWVHAMLFVLVVSLAFDLRDALRYFIF